MIKVSNSMIVILAITLALVATGVSIYTSGKEDAPLEEFSEEMLEGTTGIDIDITPGSPELP